MPGHEDFRRRCDTLVGHIGAVAGEAQSEQDGHDGHHHDDFRQIEAPLPFHGQQFPALLVTQQAALPVQPELPVIVVLRVLVSLTVYSKPAIWFLPQARMV